MDRPTHMDEPLEEREILIHRFLDNDLEPQERLQFLEAWEHDPGLRRELVEMERLFVQSATLPRFVPPGDMKARVLQQLQTDRAGIWDRLKQALFTPYMFYWNPATALAVVGMLIAFAWGINRKSTNTPFPTSGNLVAFEESGAPVLVRLVLMHSDAQSVAVAGDFNGWTPDVTPLRQTRDGVWTVTLKVQPGRYQYMYVVDGQNWMTDPLAVEYSLDGFGAKNAVLDVEQSL